MTTHRLKVLIKYADAIMNGTKTFEVRKNDRGYEVGDKIVFDVVTNEGYAVGAAARHPLNGATYRSTTSSTTSRASPRSAWHWPYPRRTDLIDRPTTTRHGKFKTKYGRETPCCEVCGYSIGDMRWNHCPKCGAAIVDD